MPEILNAGAWITVEDKELEEYGTEKTSDNSVVCYIPSKEGQRFSLKVKHGDITTDMPYVFYLYIDGVLCNGRLCPAGCSETQKGIPVSPTTIKPFIFSAMTLTDDESVLNTDRRKAWAQLGTIDVVVCRVLSEKDIPVGSRTRTNLDSGPVHELSKKSGSHRTKLGDAVTSNVPLSSCTVTTLESRKAPYAKFTFHYRPRALLQAQGIIPAPPIPRNPAPLPPAYVRAKRENRKRRYDPTVSASDDPTKVTQIDKVKPEKPEISTSQPKKRKRPAEIMERLRALKDEIDSAELESRDNNEEEVEIVNAFVKKESSPIRVPPPRRPGKRILIDLTND
ncbi:hypothetical protein C8Q75DRAFT_282822 [Abortiporus biennis]|nr:hypothetical protein C8Q75DRAFT_282822 [Abortiporus biennis]